MAQPEAIDRRGLLGSISIFEGLNAAQLDQLLGITRTRHIARGEILFRKGDPGEELYGVMQGRLRVSGSSDDGGELVFGFMDPGEVFGEVALLDSSPRSATVEAVEACDLLSLHRGDFLPFLGTHPQVAVNLAAVLADRLRRLSTLLEDTLTLSIPSRLALNLVSLADACGPGPDRVCIEIELPRNHLDQLVAPARESVREQLEEWSEAGLIRCEGKGIRVLSVDALEALARFLIS